MGEPIFLSYSHADEKWKRLLEERIKNRAPEISVWSDRAIAAGDDWHREIEAAISRAAVAILLVSDDFLESEVIIGFEIPKILERHARRRLRIIPVIVSGAKFKQTPWLAQLQARPQDGRPLASMSDAESEHAVTEVALEAVSLARNPTRRNRPRTWRFLALALLLFVLLGLARLASLGGLRGAGLIIPTATEKAKNGPSLESRPAAAKMPVPAAVAPKPPRQPARVTETEPFKVCKDEAHPLFEGQMTVRLSFHIFDGFEVGTATLELPEHQVERLALVGPAARSLEFEYQTRHYRLAIIALDVIDHCATFKLSRRSPKSGMSGKTSP